MTDPNEHHEFETLLGENHGALVRLARHYAAASDWQDLLQEMRLQLWRSWPSFDGRSQRSTWVYRVALNTALGHRRKPNRQHQSLDSAPERGDAGVPVDEMALLERFIASLDPIQKALLLLDLEGMEREQIAEVTGLSVNAVAIRMTRLRKTFENDFMENA
jgi:RNA polymerase sigma-70 factor (ECF subfamily)